MGIEKQIMVDFFKIQDDRLRSLAMGSPAIISLNESVQTQLIEKLAAAQSEKQQALIVIFEKEQSDLAAAEKSKMVEVDSQIAAINDLMARLNNIERQYSLAVSNYAEVKSQTNDEKVLGQLLEQLDKI